MLTEPKNALLKQYRYLHAHTQRRGLCGHKGRISEVARLAIKKRTGARALRNILESMLLEAMFQAPDDDVATVLVDDMAVRGEEPVKLLSEKHDEQSWEEATKPDEKVAA